MTQTRANAGYTVIEVLAALSMFAIVAAGLTTTTVGTIRANNTSKQAATAAALIQEKFEQLRAPNAAAGDLTAGSHTDSNNPLTPLGERNGKFTRTWVVTRNTPKYGVAQVAVTVTWNSPENRSMSGVTYVCTTTSCS